MSKGIEKLKDGDLVVTFGLQKVYKKMFIEDNMICLDLLNLKSKDNLEFNNVDFSTPGVSIQFTDVSAAEDFIAHLANLIKEFKEKTNNLQKLIE